MMSHICHNMSLTKQTVKCTCMPPTSPVLGQAQLIIIIKQGKMGRMGPVPDILEDNQGALEGRHPHSTQMNVNNAHISAGGGDYFNNFDHCPISCCLCKSKVVMPANYYHICNMASPDASRW